MSLIQLTKHIDVLVRTDTLSIKSSHFSEKFFQSAVLFTVFEDPKHFLVKLLEPDLKERFLCGLQSRKYISISGSGDFVCGVKVIVIERIGAVAINGNVVDFVHQQDDIHHPRRVIKSLW